MIRCQLLYTMKPEGSFFICIKFNLNVPTQSKDINKLSVFFDRPSYVYENRICLYLQVPRLGGIKKGWARVFVVVCDFKLFLYDIPLDRTSPSPVVYQVLDMR